MTVASLPMYDLPEIEAATNKWWSGLALAFCNEGIVGVPQSLCRSNSYRDLWTRSDLLLSQTCGYPLTHELRDKVSLVATPCYGAPGCSGSEYCSIVIVRADSTASDIRELRRTRCVINSRTSHSGYNALRALIAPIAGGERFFHDVTISGSHPNSVTMVSNGEADVAAIDCITHALLTRYRPAALAGTRPLCYTPHAPAMPYITHLDAEGELLNQQRRGIEAACHDPTLSDCRDILMLRGFHILSIGDYQPIAEMEADALNRGYSEMS
jgi:ABC-type phosphate/phosphonate transport system substrate-binding protein